MAVRSSSSTCTNLVIFVSLQRPSLCKVFPKGCVQGRQGSKGIGSVGHWRPAWKDLVYRASNVGRGGHGLVQTGGPKDGHEMQCHYSSCQASADGKSVKGERAES